MVMYERNQPGGWDAERIMELVIIGTVTTIALLAMQAQEYLRSRGSPYPPARYPQAAAAPPRRVLHPYVAKDADEDDSRSKVA